MFLLGSGVQHLKATLEQTGEDVTPVTVEKFPDEEVYIQLPEDLPEMVYYVQSCYPHPNQKVVETLLTFDALHDQNVDVTPLFPYMAYAKQDHTFQPGEPVSIRATLHALSSRGMEHPFFINTHFLKTPGKHEPFNLSCTNLNAAPHLLDTVTETEDMENPVIVLPGGGAQHLLPDWNGETVTVDTERETGTGFQPLAKTELIEENAVDGRDVVVLDDLIATGGTMTQTCHTVVDAGAEHVVAAAVHGLFLDDATTRIQEHVDAVYTTDTVSPPETVEIIPVTPVFEEFLQDNA